MTFHSQHGEDEKLWSFFHGRKNGVCVEVGGFDGVTFSNTLFFEEQGWRAILVEPIPVFAERIRARRPGATLYSCAAGPRTGEITLAIPHGEEALATTAQQPAHMARIEKTGAALEQVVVPMRALDDLLSEAGVSEIDFVTIDVEGAELDVLAGFDLDRWRPRVVILENNDRRSLALQQEMLRRGYHWLTNTDCNEWYVPEWETSLVTAGRKFRNSARRFGLRISGAILRFREATGLRSLERRLREAGRSLRRRK